MQTRIILFVAGVMLCVLALCQAVMLCVSLLYADGCAASLGLSALVLLLLGVVGLACRTTAVDLTHRDGFAIVGMGWIVAGFAGALPYILGMNMPMVDAFFESVSGFTTTGASILTNIEAVPQSLLLWRSLTQWLGGMGIMLLSILVLPLLGVGGMQLYKAEVPGPTKDKLTPRVRDTAFMLWKIYVILTLIQIGLLWLAGMTLFEAVNHAFTTLATGGFSTRNDSVAAYASPAIQWIIIVFMAAAGMNFALHVRLFAGQPRYYARDTEWRGYMLLLLGAVVLTVLALWGKGTFVADSWRSVEHTVRAAAFQVVSICTTTGYATEDYLTWPFAAQMILLLLMFAGGCAGSTAGGIKCLRIVLVMRFAYQEIFRLIHPNAKRPVKLHDKPVNTDIMLAVVGFVLTYCGILGVSTLLLAAFELDLLTAFSASLTCLSNVGPGFASVGPAENFAHLPAFVKIWLSICMLAGRLELYAILLLFTPAFWRR